jgi:hypothetical protein
MQSNGYVGYLATNHSRFSPDFEATVTLSNALKSNIADVYNNLDRV